LARAASRPGDEARRGDQDRPGGEPGLAVAARAAVSAAAALGVTGVEPVILADGANVIVHLAPSPLVAKVPASTTAVRPGVAAWLAKELDLARFLAAAGAPVMTPSAEVPATVHHADGNPMSFWTYLRPADAGPPDEATIGSLLRDLHAVLRDYPTPLPPLAPLADIPAFLARRPSSPASQTVVSAADAAILAETYRRLTGELAAASGGAPVQALHGDAGAGNLMATGGQWVWHDFEDACSGPVAWDLAATTATPRFDRARVLSGYAGPGEPAAPADPALRACERLRLLHLTIWYCLYAERLPDCRQRAAELLSSWRTP
jgi:Ser/Thr protein kinase RdoA (MazF antagonist)